MDTDVVIAGGGPNGLMLAAELSLAGVRPVLLEQLAEPSRAPRANGLVGQVIRLLDHRGLLEPFGGAPGTPRPAPHHVFGAFPLDLTVLDTNPLHTLLCPQLRMEQVLQERADTLGVEIRRGHELLTHTQDEQGVTLQVQGPDGTYRLRTRFLVGCDGGRSTVRKQAGIAFPGVSGPDVVSRTAHVTLPEALLVPGTGELDVPGFGRIRPFTHTRTERGVFVFAAVEPGKPLVSTLEWADPASGPAPREQDGAPMTLEELAASAHRVLGVELPLAAPTSAGPHLLRRVLGGNTRLAERYREGRVLLVGDAAHVHSAVGGPGLNLGLQDAANLGWKLAAEVQGWAPPGLLDSYHAERYPVGERVFMHSQAQSAIMAPGPGITALRVLFGELLQRPENVRHIAETMAGSDVRYQAPPGSHPLVGRFSPELSLRVAGTAVRLAELLRNGRPLLLDLAGQATLTDPAAPWRDRVDVVTATCEAPPAAALLIRPDGYLAWAAATDAPPATAAAPLREALATWFGPPTAP
ncbi:FAD-dependent monooxygenase [Kitasatospora nipponensis]|uniref:FAD-dependent monooxygenase n=1 Tax=Kitasatospora nipponensis TaxID=258049 RepID=A0ABN1W8F2_9ACTN